MRKTYRICSRKVYYKFKRFALGNWHPIINQKNELVESKIFLLAPNQGWFKKKKESLFINIWYIVTILLPPLNCFVAEAQHAVLSSLCPCFPRVQKSLPKSGSFPPSHHLCTLLLLSQPLLHLTVFCGSVFLILNKTQLLATHARLCLYNGRLEEGENSVSRLWAQSCWAATPAGRWDCTGTGEGQGWGHWQQLLLSTRSFVHH